MSDLRSRRDVGLGGARHDHADADLTRRVRHHGAGRILALLDKYAIRSAWFVPGVVIETYPEVCARIVEQGHEIGHHGWTHVPPATLSRAKEAEGLMLGNRAIEKLRGRPARGAARRRGT